MNNRKLVLESGQEFYGKGFGSDSTKIAELCFNTSVVGYQEILSDPANYNRIICMTYPVIGSYGLNDEDYESKSITCSGVIVKEYNDMPSNFRYTHKLDEAMEDSLVPGISGIDTRELTRLIRDNGTMKAMICDAEMPLDKCLEELRSYNDIDELPQVSTKKPWYSRTTNPLFTVVAIDLGIRKSVVKNLNKVGFNVIVVPYNTSIDEIMKFKPHGVLISDGPFNPLRQEEIVNNINGLKGKLPILGIGNGQNLIALSYGANVEKEKVGHNGCNIPVRNLATGKIEICVFNSMYSVLESSINSELLTITHKNVLDGFIAGLENVNNNVITVNYNPVLNESLDNVYLRFLNVVKKARGENNAKKN